MEFEIKANPVTKRHHSDASASSFDAMFLQAQNDNLISGVPLHSAASVISMEDDEFADEGFTDHGPFTDFSVLKKKPAHLSVFLHFLMSNSNPSALFFTIVTDSFQHEQGSVKELKKWAYEIFSTFATESAPLRVKIPQEEELAIEEALDSPRTTEERIRTIFHVTREYVSHEVNEQLADFRNKRALGLGGMFGDHQLEETLDRNKEVRIVEDTLSPHLEALMQDVDSSSIDSPQNDRK